MPEFCVLQCIFFRNHYKKLLKVLKKVKVKVLELAKKIYTYSISYSIRPTDLLPTTYYLPTTTYCLWPTTYWKKLV